MNPAPVPLVHKHPHSQSFLLFAAVSTFKAFHVPNDVVLLLVMTFGASLKYVMNVRFSKGPLVPALGVGALAGGADRGHLRRVHRSVSRTLFLTLGLKSPSGTRDSSLSLSM